MYIETVPNRNSRPAVLLREGWREGKKVRNVPLGKGQIDPDFFKMLADTGFRGPISLHEEYLDHKNPELVDQHWQAIKTDLATLKALI